MSHSLQLAVVAFIVSTIGCGQNAINAITDEQSASTPAMTAASGAEAAIVSDEKSQPQRKENSGEEDVASNFRMEDLASPSAPGLGMPTVDSLLQGGSLDPLLRAPLQIETNSTFEPTGGMPIYQQPGVPGALR